MLAQQFAHRRLLTDLAYVWALDAYLRSGIYVGGQFDAAPAYTQCGSMDIAWEAVGWACSAGAL